MAALKFVSQARVVDTQALQDGCLQIMYVDRIFGDVVAVIILSPNVRPGLMPPPASHIVKQRGW